MIAYPTDLGLIARSRQESERIIDELCQSMGVREKPRTYRRMARKQYLNVAKKKNKTRHEVRKAIGQQLRYLRRNLKSINGLLDRGQGKNGYNLSKVRARAARTSESWIAAIFFVMNLVKFSKDFLFSILNTLLEPFILVHLHFEVQRTGKMALNE